MAAMRVLITGGTGFIGRHVVAELIRQGAEINIVSRTQPQLEQSGVRWHKGDVLNSTEIKNILELVGPDILVHTAWYSEHGRFWEAPENEEWLDQSTKLTQMFADVGGKRAIFVGTCAEYDWENLGEGICHEDITPIHGRTLYGKCKNKLHERVGALSEEYGFEYAWGRVFQPFGEDELPNRLVPAIIHALNEGRECPCTEGSQVRDFMDVREVGRGLGALALSSVIGAVNIASGKGVSVAHVAQLIGEIMGRRELLKMGAIPTRVNEPVKFIANVDRLKNEVGFKQEIDLESGIRHAIDWHRLNKI